MDNIKASELKAAIQIQAKIVVSDGRWDQWSDLLLQQLKTIGEWKPGKWTTDSDFYLYTFEPKGRGKLADGSYVMGSIRLAFVDSGSGNNYEFSHAAFISKLAGIPDIFAYGEAAAKKYRKGTKVASGKDLIAAIATDQGVEPIKPEPATALASYIILMPEVCRGNSAGPKGFTRYKPWKYSNAEAQHGILYAKVESFDSDTAAIEQVTSVYAPQMSGIFSRRPNLKGYTFLVYRIDNDTVIFNSAKVPNRIRYMFDGIDATRDNLAKWGLL